MEIITKYMKKNPYYNDNRWIYGNNFKGFFLHSVGCSQPNPDVFYRTWNDINYKNAGISGFIGEDKVYITAPCFEEKGRVKRMPHAGKKATNNGYIGFEMCEPNTIKYTGGSSFICLDKVKAQEFVEKVYNNAVELFAELCKFHNKNPLDKGVIYSHDEGRKLGIATAHYDPEHLWKGLNLPYTMETFRKDVYNKMHENDKYIKNFYELPDWARKDMRELLDSNIINGGTDASYDNDDINMYLSDIKTVIICKRLVESKL